jgi:hypothetical protein
MWHNQRHDEAADRRRGGDAARMSHGTGRGATRALPLAVHGSTRDATKEPGAPTIVASCGPVRV